MNNEDNSFNNQGIMNEEPEQMEEQNFPRANGNPISKFGKGLAQGVKNAASGNLMKGVPKPNKNDPSKGQKKPDDKKKKDGLDKDGNKDKKKDNEHKNPLPGAGNKKSKDPRDANDKKPSVKKENNSKEKGGLASRLNPFNRRRGAQQGALGKEKTDNGNKMGNLAKKEINKAKGFFMNPAIPIQYKIIAIFAPILLFICISLLILIVVSGVAVVSSLAGSICDRTEYSDATGTSEDAVEFMCNMSDPLGGTSTVTSLFGWRNYNPSHMHLGNDLTGQSNILAAGAGEVVYAGLYEGYGYTVGIDHGNGVKTLYGHMSSISVSKGQKVKVGDKLGIMGGTGLGGQIQYGVHLHFEVRVGDDFKNSTSVSVNPFFGYSDKGYENCITDNGTFQKDCGLEDSSKTTSRAIGEEAFKQICGKSKNYSSAEISNECCESSNQSNDKNIKDFINVFEGSGGYCDSGKTQYKAYQNSGDRITIGYGVTSDYLPNLVKDGQCIDVDEVDAAEIKAINTKRNSVIKPIFSTAAVTLSEHQEDAMTSMAYNGCGSFFADIAKAAKKDDLEAVWKAMKDCTNGGMLGLQRRRKAEFALYVTGDYNSANEYKEKSWSSTDYDNYDSDGVIAKKASGSSSTCSFSGSSSQIKSAVVEKALEELEAWNSTTDYCSSIKKYMKSCGSSGVNDYCAAFTTYVLKEAGATEAIGLPKYSCSVGNFKDITKGEKHEVGGSYTPVPGDLIVHRNWEHITIVEKVEGKTVHYIGGNEGADNYCGEGKITKGTFQLEKNNSRGAKYFISY